jgi:hypothetical protein
MRQTVLMRGAMLLLRVCPGLICESHVTARQLSLSTPSLPARDDRLRGLALFSLSTTSSR